MLSIGTDNKKLIDNDLFRKNVSTGKSFPSPNYNVIRGI